MYFISAESKFLGKTINRENTETLGNILYLMAKLDWGMSFRKISGFYDGFEETSYQIESDFPEMFHKEILFLGRIFGQESILHVTEDKDAWLYYTNGKVEKIGKFVQTTKDVKELLGYSIIDGLSYTIEETKS